MATVTAPGPLPPGQDRAALVAEVAASLADVPEAATVVVACSGGPDSTALAFLTAEGRPDLELVLGHVRHGLRDDTADLAVVGQHAAWLGCHLEVVEVTVTRDGHGPQAAARHQRFRVLRRLLHDHQAAALLVGHTAEDQAETVLLRAARGTGSAGLAAMARADHDLRRPLLRLRRADIHRYVSMEGLPVAHDPTNQDPAQPRVHVRNVALPALAPLAGDPVGALGRLADLARDDDLALSGWAAEIAAQETRHVGPVRNLRRAALDALPAAVARRVVRHLLVEVSGGGLPPSSRDVARVEQLTHGARTELRGGVHASAAAGWLSIAPARMSAAPSAPLRVGGAVDWLPAELRVVAIGPQDAAGEASSAAAGPDRGQQVAFDLVGTWVPPRRHPPHQLTPPGGREDRLTVLLPAGLEGLTVRHRAPGDRVRTAVGTTRLSDALIDLGVPRPVRDRWPVVAVDEQVVWIPGVAADHELAERGRREPGLLLAVERMAARDRGGLDPRPG